MQTRVSAERIIEAPAEVVYHLISDYKEHHNPAGFLPPAFPELHVEQGGVGAGTVVRFTSKLAGQTKTIVASISEPVPGRVLVESSPGLETTFTVEPVLNGAAGSTKSRVRFDTVMEAGGLEGLIARLFAPGILRPVYADEMARLEQHAKAHPALVGVGE
jgi:hypothetical protein